MCLIQPDATEPAQARRDPKNLWMTGQLYALLGNHVTPFVNAANGVRTGYFWTLDQMRAMHTVKKALV